jgi:hypothetical protein
MALWAVITASTAVPLAPSCQPARAQFGQGILDGTIFNGALTAAKALRSYYRDNQQLPRDPNAQDKVLVAAYQNINGCPPDPTMPITTVGTYRVLANLRIATVETIRDAPIEQWRQYPPDNWIAPANSIVMMTDGNNQFIVWCAALNGVPMKDANNRCLIIYDKLKPMDDNEKPAQNFS